MYSWHFFHSLHDIFFAWCPPKPWQLQLASLLKLKVPPKKTTGDSPQRIFCPPPRKHLHLLESQRSGPASGSTWICRQSRSCLWASETEPEDESRWFMYSVGACWSGWKKSSGWWTGNLRPCSAASCLLLCNSQWPSCIPLGCRASLL